MTPLSAAAPFLGTPYVLHGRGPRDGGWDCWGCVAILRERLFGLPTPSWADAYSPADAMTPATVERLITDRLDAWRPVERRPGAVALFELLGRPVHVGLVLDARDFIHTMAGVDTSIERLDLVRWSRRLRGFYDAR